MAQGKDNMPCPSSANIRWKDSDDPSTLCSSLVYSPEAREPQQRSPCETGANSDRDLTNGCVDSYRSEGQCRHLKLMS